MVNKSMPFLDLKRCQKRPQAPKPIFLGQESENSEKQNIFSKLLKIQTRIFVVDMIIYCFAYCY